MISAWTVTYAVAALVVVGLSYPAWRAGLRLRWLPLVVWLLAAAILAVLCWSMLVCSRLPFFGGQVPHPSGITEWGLCVAGSSIWAAFVAAFALPFYALLLSWTSMRWRKQPPNRASLLRSALLLGAPVGLALLYGYAAPFNADLVSRLGSAVPFSVAGWLATSLGLLIPRLVADRATHSQLATDDSA